MAKGLTALPHLHGLTLCGHFSFADKPTRMGVLPGTLPLGAGWHINGYGIQCALPSVYTKSSLSPCGHPPIISPSGDFFTDVAKEMMNHVDRNGAVLV